MHVIVAKAVAFAEALKPEFKDYAKQIIKNSKALGEVFKERELDLVTGGTKCYTNGKHIICFISNTLHL
ncbi:serine hydroxymethyltransferase family protein [Ehrlichia chaffeensis str. Liberty]|nr:serine hydroxymethyltransferase family protein [Ehrlichia chaffeensis str. Jax]AHX06824.1 serine hydroxymethyltransferase family protein [Ehrlichia chaffeensis str. Liberty]AHX08676.1 serine hydroxymethyltransferase family protein [Ehrlichia chaffeensis str. Saint Vincent]AHX09736.1 serine hydroxymethyltransferase family protein [Ehrlichia chaffeensis str. Wakulla]